MDRDRRLTGYLRGQSDRPIAPAGFEFSNGWRVRRLPASFPPSAMSAPRADPVSRSRSVSSNAAAPSRNETSIQNTIALHVSLVSLFLFFLSFYYSLPSCSSIVALSCIISHRLRHWLRNPAPAYCTVPSFHAFHVTHPSLGLASACISHAFEPEPAPATPCIQQPTILRIGPS